MVYGDEKARDMARSLLPSKNREAARANRVSIHRSERRRSRMETARLAREPESFEDLAGLDGDSGVELSIMVNRRRGGDKVAPFIRWATAITRPLPQETRLSHVRALVPRGIIGEHALQHLAHLDDFEHPSETVLAEARRRAYVLRRRSASKWLDRGEQAELLRALLQAPGGHRTFNRWLQVSHVPQYQTETRRRPCTCEPGCTLLEAVNVPVSATRPRLLLGVHDVLPFLSALWDPPDKSRWKRGPHADQLGPVNDFLRAFKRCHGDVAATAKELRLESRAHWRPIAPTLLVPRDR
jgi:hypothetical protein